MLSWLCESFLLNHTDVFLLFCSYIDYITACDTVWLLKGDTEVRFLDTVMNLKKNPVSSVI